MEQPHHDELWERRKFITTLTKATGSTLFLSMPLMNKAEGIKTGQAWTVGAIMDLFIKEIQGAPFASTVDTLKSGKRETVVTGVVTTMFPTIEVIRKTIDAGANFIIAHEPSYYNHQDSTDWLQDDAIFRYKWELLQKHDIAIWRNHDYIHSYKPDGVLSSVIARLGWQQYQSNEMAHRLLIPAISLRALIEHLKKNLGIKTLRFIGDTTQICKKILLMPGAAGGRRHIEATRKEQPDVLIVGEIQEWETAEYIR
ncbi:MAG TPA: Nif3-like dinuclear metal center hexameric protein, partial [Chitinophagaceae bacterium]|nr:Nif3-like dinuclear metal center hexameric protein [Chitinophagaceae bacterium]